ncbi:hypothetical protein tb265_18500 [Gemmatimonadetes bacterium T265]|nr:hypothetical protein tb265_18500 [Gemmatimonadetes bacterium T265]
MKRFAPCSTALLLAAAALAACSSSDPLAPRPATAVRAPTPTAGPSLSSGYMVTWTKDGSTPGATANSGYMVTWTKDGGGNAGATTNGGYMVTWTKDGGASTTKP